MVKEKTIYSDVYYGNPPCNKCAHLHINLGTGVTGCLAFPNGIPEEAHGGYTHKAKIEGQVGDYVYQEAKYEDLSPFGKWLWDKQEKLSFLKKLVNKAANLFGIYGGLLAFLYS